MKDQIDKGTKWFIVVVIVVLAVGAALSAVFWTDLVGTGDNKDSLSTTVRNVMLMIGALLALLLAIWRGWVAERQVKATQQSVDAAHEAIANQRFQAAALMLGDEVNAVRLGAMHTLVALSRENPEQYYIQAVKLLAAFIRSPTSGDNVQDPKKDQDDGTSVREDVGFALNFIGSRSSEDLRFERSQDFAVDLDRARLVKVDLRGLNLSRATLRHATLARAICTDTDFSEGDLSFASLSEASLEGASFSDATLSGTDFSTPHRAVFIHPRSQRDDEPRPASGLIQSQLDEANYDGQQPPNLRGVRDANTGEDLLWHGRVPKVP